MEGNGSLYYLNKHAAQIIESKGWSDLKGHSLPGWVSHREIATATGHNHRAIEAAEKAVGGRYRWATEFENVHTVWRFPEKGFEYAGIHWNGSEQLFQCLKWGSQFEKHKNEFCALSTMDSYALGRTAEIENVEEWNREGRIRAMQLALSLKFGADQQLRDLLLSTGDDALVSIKGDVFWGIGFDGTGQNKLGELLVALRSELRVATLENA